MKRKIYNVDPTPSPECAKIIKEYEATCKEYNDSVKEAKDAWKKNEDTCKSDIKKWEAEKKTINKEIKDIETKFNAAALKFAKGMPNTDKFKRMVKAGVRFLYGGINLVELGVVDNVNCYLDAYRLSNGNIIIRNPPRSSDFSPENAAKAFALLVDLRQKNADEPNDDKRRFNRFFSEPELQKLGFVNDIVVNIERNNAGFPVLDSSGKPKPTRRNHNGVIYTLKDQNGNYITEASGGFKLIREFTEDFIAANSEIVKERQTIIGKKDRLKELDKLIVECQSYLDNKKDKNGKPINLQRQTEKEILDSNVKFFKGKLDRQMKNIKDKGCTAPKKCDEPTLIR